MESFYRIKILLRYTSSLSYHKRHCGSMEGPKRTSYSKPFLPSSHCKLGMSYWHINGCTNKGGPDTLLMPVNETPTDGELQTGLPSPQDEKMPYSGNFAQYIKKCQNGIIWHFMTFLLIKKFWKSAIFPQNGIKNVHLATMITNLFEFFSPFFSRTQLVTSDGPGKIFVVEGLPGLTGRLPSCQLIG